MGACRGLPRRLGVEASGRSEGEGDRTGTDTFECLAPVNEPFLHRRRVDVLDEQSSEAHVQTIELVNSGLGCPGVIEYRDELLQRGQRVCTPASPSRLRR